MVKIPDWYETRDQIIESPDGWTGGKVRHTGGGIFCREWERSLPGGRRITVIYNTDETGIGVNHYPDTEDYGVDESMSGLAMVGPHMDHDLHSDRGYAEAAKRVMHVINMTLEDAE